MSPVICDVLVGVFTDTITFTSSQITTARPIIPLNQADDITIGLYDITIGLYNTTAGHSVSPGLIVYGPGIGTAFIVTPLISNATVTCGLLFATVNEFPNRDPLTVNLEGSKSVTIAAFNLSAC